MPHLLEALQEGEVMFGDQDYELAAVKRGWVPEWLWWLVCHIDPMRRLPTKQPLRWIFTTPVDPGEPSHAH
jgi:hypothetical protein